MTKAEEKKSNVTKETEEAAKTAEENKELTMINPEAANESWWRRQSKTVKGVIIGGAVLLGTGIAALGKAIWDAVRKDDDDDEIDGTDLGKVDDE